MNVKSLALMKCLDKHRRRFAPKEIHLEKETEAGGRLRTGVTAYRLVSVDFSPLK